MNPDLLAETTVVGLGGRVTVYGPQEAFYRRSSNYPRTGISLFESKLKGRIIFVRDMKSHDSLLLTEAQSLLKAKLAGKLEMLTPSTNWASLEVSKVGSVFLSAAFVEEQNRQDHLVAVVVALDAPIAVIREYQVSPVTHQEVFDGWAIVRLDDVVVRKYLEVAKLCETGGPTRFEVFELGLSNNLFRTELQAWRGEQAAYFGEPFTGVQPNQVALINLR